VRRNLGSIVLGFEAVVMFFAALVIFGLHALPALVALIGGAIFCVLLLACAALLRYSLGYALGWVLQAAIVATCVLVPALAVIAVIFVGLWIYCMVKGAQIDRANAARAAADPGSAGV
jgi:hypothetical protein